MRVALLLALLILLPFGEHAALVEAEPLVSKLASCEAAPAGTRTGFRHRRSKWLSRAGSPRHRGIDLIAVEGDESQTLGGKLTYTKSDKDLEDEDVEIFACLGDGWRSLGTARSDDDGRFAMRLEGDKRLPVGMTDLYVFVKGDGSGARFLGFVAAKGESVIVSDVDGTITASEDAVYDAVLRGRDIGHQPGAPEVYMASGKTVVYLTARGDQFTEMTRAWLRRHGFPPGPLRMVRGVAVLPGSRTVAYKTSTLRSLRVPIAAGVGNRASDVAAYRNAGLAPDKIFINLPEFTKELRAVLAAGKATGFDQYKELTDRLR